MSRWLWFMLCAILGPVMLVCGWLVPSHLRAVDASVIQRAGRNTSTLVEQGLALGNEKRLGAAQMLWEAAQQQGVPGGEKLGQVVSNLAAQHPDWQAWGGPAPLLEKLFTSPGNSGNASQPFAEVVVPEENRAKVLTLLGASTRPGVQEFMRCRTLTNTVLFPPSSSSSGQAFDTALSMGGLLLETGQLGSGLASRLTGLAADAIRGGDPQLLEQMLLDLMSLGQRLNWGQYTAFVSQIQDAETLRQLANLARLNDAQLPVLFSAVQLSGRAAEVAHYLVSFSATGMKDLGFSLRYGAGAVKELVSRGQQVYSSSLRQRVVQYAPFGGFFSFWSDYCWLTPWFALSIKWLFYLSGGFLLAAGMHYAKPAVSTLEQPLQVRGIHFAREVLFALGFLLVVLLVSEPFLAQESQKVDFPFRLRLPMVGNVVPAGTHGAPSSLMNNLSLLTLLLFFVLQSLIYTACLVKLAEIRRQKVGPRIKLKLLENEDHLFDAGLYLGFVGTIISLILVSLGVIKPSLMAAYSSTSFGIIFVSIFKIFHLRPVRRKLLLEAETGSGTVEVPAVAPTLATPS